VTGKPRDWSRNGQMAGYSDTQLGAPAGAENWTGWYPAPVAADADDVDSPRVAADVDLLRSFSDDVIAAAKPSPYTSHPVFMYQFDCKRET